MEEKNFIQTFIEAIKTSIEKEVNLNDFLKFNAVINRLKNEEINLLIVGETGVGKSSTISALFGGTLTDKIKSGQKPMTKEIERYSLDNLIIWDTPGLGDSTENDKSYAKKIEELLNKRNEKGEFLIDVVLVVISASNRAMDSTFKVIKEVVIPNMKKENIVIAINKIDSALDDYWDKVHNCPLQNPEVSKYLENEIIKPINKRIKEETNLDIIPIYYAAGKIDILSKKQNPGYNLRKLFSCILEATPLKKRMGYVEKVNKNEEVWKSNDIEKDYLEEIKNTFFATIYSYIVKELPNILDKLITVGKKIFKLDRLIAIGKNVLGL